MSRPKVAREPFSERLEPDDRLQLTEGANLQELAGATVRVEGEPDTRICYTDPRSHHRPRCESLPVPPPSNPLAPPPKLKPKRRSWR